MTCIVGLVHKGVGYIAADSAISDDSQVDICATPKIVKAGDTLIGCAGDWKGCHSLLDLFGANPPRDLLDVKSALNLLEVPKRGRNVDVLVVTPEAVWTYSAPLWTPLKHHHPFAAIGAGAPYALGCLWSRETTVEAYEAPADTAAWRAVTTAAQFCPGVRAPVNVLQTEAPHEQP